MFVQIKTAIIREAVTMNSVHFWLER